MGLRGDYLATLLFRLSKHWSLFFCHDTGEHGSAFHYDSGLLHRYLFGYPAFSLYLAICLQSLCSVALCQPASLSHADRSVLFYADFSQLPDHSLWTGDLNLFRVDSTREGRLLRQDAGPDRSNAWLATQHHYEPRVWEWYFRQAFEPSQSNRVFFFLNNKDPDSPDSASGIALQTGENGHPKHFRLVRFHEGRPIEQILKSDLLIEEDTGYRIRIIRTPQGAWHLYAGAVSVNPALPARTPASQTPLLQPGEVPPESIGHQNGHFGFQTHFSTTRRDRFFFGDIILRDDFPEPAVTELHTQRENGKKRLTIVFEVPPATGALSPAGFKLDGTMEPEEIHCLHPQICDLYFHDNGQTGRHFLVVHPYSTIYGQKSRIQQISFYSAAEARPQDIVINEFFLRPSNYYPEYIELYNRSDETVDLKNWRLQRRPAANEPLRLITTDHYYLEPGRFLVITPSANLDPTQFPGGTSVIGMDNYPRFNQSASDQIRLFDQTGVMIDSVHFDPARLPAGISRERKSPTVPGWHDSNWTGSSHSTGGTPGYVNTARPPGEPPRLVSLDYAKGNHLLLYFDRMLHPDTEERARFVLESATESQSPAFQQTDTSTIALFPSLALDHLDTYLLKMEEVSCLFGNVMEPSQRSFIYHRLEHIETGDLVINEILYRPAGAVRRFVELLNRSEKAVDLRPVRIGRSLGNPVSVMTEAHNIPHEPLVLLPGEKIVLSETGMPLPETKNHIEIQNFPSYSRFGDAVYILTADAREKSQYQSDLLPCDLLSSDLLSSDLLPKAKSQAHLPAAHFVVVDSLFYQPEWGGNRDGISLERVDPFGSSTDPVNWRSHPGSHSGGMRNFHRDDNPGPPKLVHARQVDSLRVELIFNRHIASGSLENIRLNGNILTRKPGDDPGLQSAFLLYSDHPILRKSQMISTEPVTDAAGRSSEALSVPLALLPEPGDLVINEIMYQPISNRYGSRADQCEFIEIANRSNLPISLKGVHVHDRADKNGQVQDYLPGGMPRAALLPDEYAVIYPDSSALFHYTRIAKAFTLPESAPDLFFRTDRLTLGLPGSGGAIYLSDPSGMLLDSVWYEPSWHNPNIIDPRGISLERILPDMPSQNRSNWSSNTHAEGGTPGLRNSVAPYRNEPERGRRLLLEPNPFSPNGDGYRDHLLIHYELDAPDYLLHLRVFDRNGRLIRTLTDGMRSGYSGTLIWDGRTDQGLMNRPGLYIVHLTARDPASGANRSDRAVAVLAHPF